MKFTFLCLLLLSLFSSLPIAAQVDRGAGVKSKDNQSSSEKRLALVIGNSTYSNTTPLINPANDAADMAAALKGLSFEVISGTNQSKRQMEMMIRTFGEKLAKQGGVGLFFYAGHGLQVNGNNYLIPVEAEIPAQDEVEYATINLGFLLGKMEAAQNDLNIVILDACRNNPFARSWRSFRDIGDGKGLAKITPPTGTIMLYATQPGNVASDGAGRNGLFTESLLKQITKPNVELDAMVKLLARDVSEKSGKKQLPWKEGIVLGDFYFAGTSTANNPPAEKILERPQPVNQIANNPDAINAGKVRKNSIGMELVYIPAGEFMMGSETGEADEKPVHKVTIGQGFWMGKYEVTQSQYEQMMGANPSKFKSCGVTCPVEQVSWNDAKEFIQKLNAKNDGLEYSLPSESQWEYAARAGTTGDYSSSGVGWYIIGGSTTHQVGAKKANDFGVYDMSGNVWEWCEDIYQGNYSNSPANGSANITVGDLTLRVLRGGSWLGGFNTLRSAARSRSTQTTRGSAIGFRVVARPR